jgi:sigma-B regulation protein RsbU (phosphoserine phosphatase)
VSAARRRPRLPSLRLLVTLIVVLPIAAVAAALVTISILTSRSIAEQLGDELVGDATGRVASEVRGYLGQAVRVSDLYARRLATGKLSSTQLAPWEQTMFDDLMTNDNVASICFGNPNGDAIYLLHAHNQLEYGISDGSNQCAAIEWPAEPSGKVDREHPIRKYTYDPRGRPYYTAALAAAHPLWTPIYFWYGEGGSESETGTGYTRTVHAKDGSLLGVLVIDVTLGAISEFLRKQDFAEKGAIFVLDRDGMLVAASEGRVNTTSGQRMGLGGSESPAARAVAPLFPATQPSDRAGAPAASAPMVAQRIVSGGKPARVNIEPLRPYPGADWRIITVLPESEFLAQAQAMQRRSILFGCVAVALAVAVGLVFSRRLSQPVLRLTEHAAHIGQGDLETQLELGGARELQQLADQTNRMSAGLKQRMQMEQSLALATHVQQSLLPQSIPKVVGLDVAAHSRYCESTGGDYYDFIDIADLVNDRAFIAVGDVMGHGIGSALVMATARAAVRASAQSGDFALGQLMGRVNDVLAADPHGLFMTLALVVVEPAKRRVRWSSAGHDPTIVYDPGADCFRDLEGGDIPLGINTNYPFQDFSRNGLGAGWVLFAGTDGVWEARNESLTDMYGKERLKEVIRANHHESAQEIVHAVARSLAQFVGRGPVLDDITFVVVKVGDCVAAAGA